MDEVTERRRARWRAREGVEVVLVGLGSAVLDTLPRVGPAMAERIMQWREDNGGFAAVEDLLSVSGIGQKTFDSLKDLVRV